MYMYMYMYMYIPTKCNIVEWMKRTLQPPRCFGLFQRRQLRADWTAQSVFSELVMERNMLKDHTPDRILQMMIKVQKQEGI